MSKHALVIDDSNTMRQMVTFTLQDAGYTVVEADNGQTALDQAKAKAFDLIITDLNMPVMDGITFIQQARKDSLSRHAPILMLTTENAPERKQAGKAAGATGWIVKPFEPATLLGAVGKVVR
ncbi:MAG: response regulator [Pirellulaceae bacterium]